MNEKTDISMTFTEEKNADNNEEGEIVITSEQYKLRLNSIFKKLNEYMKKYNCDVRDLFKELIFRPNFEDQNIECNEEAIFLSSFVDLLKTININLDTIDSYCIYMRLKIIENFEAISLNYLEHELKNIANGNEIDETNNSKRKIKNENNNKSNNCKSKEPTNENKEKIQDQMFNLNKNIKQDNHNPKTNNIKEQLALIDTESENESLEEFDDSGSKIESHSGEEGNINSKNILCKNTILVKNVKINL